MPKWVRLLDALENPRKYGDISQIPIDYVCAYQPEPRIEILVKKRRGNKTYSEEVKVVPKYYATIFKGKVYLISNEVTLEELSINNEKKAIRKIQEDAERFGNVSLKAKGVDWDEERVEILNTLPKFLRNIGGWYWTTIPCTGLDRQGHAISGLKLIYNGAVQGEDNFGILSCNKEPNTSSAPIRPLILLPSDIMVDVQNFDGGPLKIKRGPQENENTETSKLSQAQNEANAKEQVVAEKATFDEIKEKVTSIAAWSSTSPYKILSLGKIYELSTEILSIIGEIEKQNPTKA